MRLYSVFDEHGALLPYARHMIDALAFLPEDDRSFYQCHAVLRSEYVAWQRHGAENYAPSRVAQFLLYALARRSQRVHVAGLVALAMFGHHATGGSGSQEAAVALVSDFMADTSQETFLYWNPRTREFEAKDAKVVSDPDSVRKIFTEYRGAAHICAARLTSVEYLEPLQPFDPAPVAEQAYLSTVLNYQVYFHRHLAKPSWNLRCLALPEGFEPEVPPLPPSQTLIEALLGTPDT